VKLCLDEHYAVQIATELRGIGHDVDCVKERPELISLSDSDLLSLMTAERRALLTENVSDFAPLVRQILAAGESHYGIIFSSPRSMPRSRNTIGPFVAALDAVMRRFPHENDFANKTEWL
jgi:Domain of unknown function (DUF5615)